MTTAFVVHDGVVALDVFGPFDALRLADVFAVERGGDAVFEPVLCALDDGPVRVASGPRLLPDRRLEDVTPSAVVVPGSILEHTVEARSALAAALRRLPDVPVVGICTGAFVLAEAGLLDGRRATTHWARTDHLAQAYPAVTVVPDALFVEDGGVWTSAGVTAGIDLALAWIRRRLGAEIAHAVARDLVVFAHRPGGQSQFSAHLAAQPSEDERIHAVQQWILGNLGADLSVPALAAHAAMSRRHFARRFTEETGSAPGAFVDRARLDAARMLLETTDLDLPAIADRCGLGSDERLRRLFRRRLSVTPGAYRRRFRRAS